MAAHEAGSKDVLTDLKIVGDDGQRVGFHDGVLGKLLGMIGRHATLENQPIVLPEHAQVPDTTAQATLDQRFKELNA